PSGPFPTGMVCTTSFVLGLISETVRWPLFATQTSPNPTATPAGPCPTGIVCTAWGFSSIGGRVPSPAVATPPAPCPAESAPCGGQLRQRHVAAAALRDDLEGPARLGQALQVDLSPLDVTDAVDGSGQVGDLRARQHLPRSRLAAQTGREVQRAASIAALHGH